MIYAIRVAFLNLRNRALQSGLTVLVIALAVGLTIAVTVLADAVHAGIVRASDAFGVLVIGPKGSAQQLILSTILLQDVPVGVMDASVYDQLLKRTPQPTIAPIAMGDNIGGAPIIGTDQNFFLLRRSLNDPPLFSLTAGRLFTRDYEAVLGAEAASGLGLRVGDSFYSMHGVGKGLSGDVHTNAPYVVVGVLARTSSPYDRAVFATTASIWSAHDAEEEGEPDAGEAARNAVTASRGKLTAALVLPYGISLNDIYQMSQDVNNGTLAQAAFPGAQLGNLFDLLDQGQSVLGAVGWLALIMAGLTVLLSLYGTTLARQQAIAVMRSLGADRRTVFIMTLVEALFLSALGAVCGVLIGHGVAGYIANVITGQSDIPVAIQFLWSQELLLIVLPILLGVLAGLLPAAMAYRTDVVEKLFAG